MKQKVQASNTLENGLHNGVIIALEYRTTPYKYTDVIIETKGKSGGLVNVKAGYPSIISPTSRMGLLLERFNCMLVVGEEIDPDKFLIGLQCTFVTEPDGKYSKVKPETVTLRTG